MTTKRSHSCLEAI